MIKEENKSVMVPVLYSTHFPREARPTCGRPTGKKVPRGPRIKEHLPGRAVTDAVIYKPRLYLPASLHHSPICTLLDTEAGALYAWA
jgi:hypothetical protein